MLNGRRKALKRNWRRNFVWEKRGKKDHDEKI